MEYNDLLNFLTRIDLAILFPMAAMFWFLKCHLDKKFDKIDKRFEKIENENKEIRTSVNRMEGAFYSKECCMLKQEDQTIKKVQ